MLVNQPLLLQACLDGKFGTIFEYGGAVFVKLDLSICWEKQRRVSFLS